ncbi:MAG: Single-stranded DNA-binding protein [Parcubacteria bacterium 32_520]|nr:MAG: Single-stranded DNA-binding protein [Parcubacteria bacterium 32_520]
MNYNRAILCGRVTKAPEILMTPSGHKVAKISLATNEYQGKGKEEKTVFHNLIAWDRTADIAQQYIVVGHEIMIEGRIDNRTYKKKDGTKGYISEVVIDRLQLGNKPRAVAVPAENTATSNYQEPPADDDNVPVIEDMDEIDISSIPF